MFGRRSRRQAGPAIVLAIGGALAGSAIAALVLHRRRRAKGPSTTDAKDLVRRLVEQPWKGDLGVIDELVSPEYVGHDPAEPEPIRGPAGVKANIEKYLVGFPGGQITVDEQIAEGDRVVTRWTARGTHLGEIAGIAPTGRDVTVSGLTISRFSGGLVVEEWTTWDTLGMLVQVGAIPEPART